MATTSLQYATAGIGISTLKHLRFALRISFHFCIRQVMNGYIMRRLDPRGLRKRFGPGPGCARTGRQRRLFSACLRSWWTQFFHEHVHPCPSMSMHVHPCPHHNLFMNISWTCSSMYHWSSIVTCMSSPYMTLLSPVTKTIVARFRRPRGAGILWGDCWCRGHCDPADKLWMVAESKINFGKCWWLMDGCWNLLKPIDLLFWTTTFNLHLFAPFFGSEYSESRISQVDPFGMSWWVTPLQIHCFGIY